MAIDITAIGLGVDTAKLKQGTRDLDNFGKTADKASRSADNTNEALNGMMSVASRLAVVLGAGGLSKSMMAQYDATTKYTAMLKNATNSQAEFNSALLDIQRIASRAQSDIASVAQVYSKFSNALQDFGATQRQIADLTETVSLGLKVSGATAQETSSAMLQLAQGMGAGTLAGDEFKAMAESAPVLMRALAESMNVPVGALKKMASEGQITSQEILKAFSNPALLETFRKQASEINTISGAWQKLKNEIGLSFDTLEKSTGFFARLSSSISQLADGIKIIRGFFAGDTLDKLNKELATYDARLNAINKGDKIIEFIYGKASTEAKRQQTLDAMRKELNARKTIVNPKTLTTQATIDNEYIDSLSKDIEKQKKANTKVYSDAKEKAKAVADYKFRLEKQLDDQIREYNNDMTDWQLKNIVEGKKAKEQAQKEYIERQQKLANDNYKEAQELYEKEAKERNEIFERANENFSRSLTDSIVRGFESGLPFIENFKRAISTAFRGYFVNIGVNFIQNQLQKVGGSIIDSIFGNGQTAGGGVGGIFKDLSNIFTTTNQSIISGIENVGALISNGMGGIRDTIGGFVGANASLLANVASYGGALLQLSQGNWAGAAGTALGTALGGPLGGAIGSALGSLAGGLFGGRVKTKKFSTGATTSYANGKLIGSSALSGLAGYGRPLGGSDALTSMGEQYSKVMGSLFKAFDLSDAIKTNSQIFQRSGKKTRAWGYFGAQFESGGSVGLRTGHQGNAQNAINYMINWVMATGITQGIKNSKLPQAIKELFDGITKKDAIANMVNSTLALAKANQALIDSFNITAEQTAKVALQSGLTGDELGAVLNQLIAFANESRTIGDALTELRGDLKDAFGGTFYSSLKEFDNALKGIDKTTEAGIESFYKLISLRDDFAKYQASIDSLKGGVKSSILNYLSDSERQAMLNADLAEMFASVNVQMPATIDELVALGKSIDYTTKEGINLASVFPNLIDAFVKTKNVITELTKTADNFATLVDFNRYKGIASNYGVSFANSYIPSYDVGTNYVPNDGLAMIHQGERIIPAKDNAILMQDSANMVGELRAMRTELANVHYALQSVGLNTGKTAKSLERMENEGIIISDIGLDGNDQIVKVEVV